MKRVTLVFVLLLGCVCLYAQYGYRYGTKFINLEPDNTMYFIETKDTESENAMTVRLQQKTIKSFSKISANRFLVVSDRQDAITSDYVSDVYKNSNQNKTVVLPRIVLSLKKGQTIETILTKLSKTVSIQQRTERRYVLKCHVSHSKEVLELIAKINTLGAIEWCEPEMLTDYKLSNSLYPQQYYLKNTGQNSGVSGIDINVEPAWSITNGNPNITVAVIDEGVDRNHEDMSGRVLSGYTINNPNGLGAPQNVGTDEETCKGHGMACAGIIGATNNSIGIRGIASNVNILPVNIVPNNVNQWNSGFGTNIEIAEAINWARQRADILSCSWGGGSPSNDITSAINNARRLGRNGRGCIVVFASGNSHPNIADVTFPGNVDGVITVGAIDNQGVIRDYSQRGVSMDLVAPSGKTNLEGDVFTTDRPNNHGYGSGNYTSRFGGTSAACPQVAGVAALMLSVRPDLTEAQVRTTLQSTARDLGTSGFDPTYGYGLVNAHAAVYAVTPRISGPTSVCNQAAYTITNFPAGATVQWSVDNTNLQLISGQGTRTATFRRNGNGANSIRARLQIGNWQMNLAFNDIWAGSPIITGIDGYESLPYPGSEYYRVAVFGSNGSNYRWSSSPVCNINPMGDGSSAVINFDRNGVYTISVTVTNNCGSDTKQHMVTVGARYSLYPNPAQGAVTLEWKDEPQAAPSAAGVMAVDKAPEAYEVQLWSGTRMLRSYRTTDKKFQFDIAPLPRGIYIVRIIKGKQTYSEKLIKE